MSTEEGGGGGRQRLGRGLSSLLGEDLDEESSTDRLRQSRTVPIDHVTPGRFQPRRRFDDEELTALAASIREKGVLQPILVRRVPEREDAYELIAGERRWRAAQRAQLHEIPVLVREFADNEALEIALIENVQRQDLTPLEEAEGYQRLIDEYGHTQEEIAQTVGRSRSHVANTLRLLGLPDGVRMLVDGGALTAGHARALLAAEDPGALAHKVVAEGLSVRATEKLAKKPSSAQGEGPRPASPGIGGKDPDTLALEADLSRDLGLKVDIRDRNGAGTLTLHYDSLDQLDMILARLNQRPTGDIGGIPADFSAPLTEPVTTDEADPSAEEGEALPAEPDPLSAAAIEALLEETLSEEDPSEQSDGAEIEQASSPDDEAPTVEIGAEAEAAADDPLSADAIAALLEETLDEVEDDLDEEEGPGTEAVDDQPNAEVDVTSEIADAWADIDDEATFGDPAEDQAEEDGSMFEDLDDDDPMIPTQ